MHSLWNTARWLVLPLVAASSAAAAQVQVRAQPVAPVQGQAAGQGQSANERAASDLSRNLRILAANPDNVAALTGAGRAALDLGDPEAALTFFGRAEELSPQDGMIKGGLGSALAMMEQPETALSFFYDAIRRGVPAVEIAAYRGLAYDLTGDPLRAQQDYNLALRRRDDPEVRRRLALSLAITGQRDPALAQIDYQLRRQDRAAWRARAFILALTGDAQGATRVVESVMPYQAAAMAPFLARLPTLSLADRARAVHFGHFPGSPAGAAAPARTGVGGPAVRAEPVTSAGRPDPNQPPLGQTVAAPSVPPPPPASPAPLAPTTGAIASAVSAGQRPAQPSSPVTIVPPPASLGPGFSARDPPAAGPLALAPTRSSVGPSNATSLTPTVRSDRPAPTPRSLADIAAIVAKLNDPPAAAKAAKPAARKAENAAPKDPSRKWVQISRARSEADLASEFRRIRAKAPKLFTGMTAWSVDQGGTNRLLVGPFKSNKEAQDFVNELARADLAAFSWTSAAGQEIKRLPAK